MIAVSFFSHLFASSSSQNNSHPLKCTQAAVSKYTQMSRGPGSAACSSQWWKVIEFGNRNRYKQLSMVTMLVFTLRWRQATEKDWSRNTGNFGLFQVAISACLQNSYELVIEHQKSQADIPSPLFQFRSSDNPQAVKEPLITIGLRWASQCLSLSKFHRNLWHPNLYKKTTRHRPTHPTP